MHIEELKGGEEWETEEEKEGKFVNQSLVVLDVKKVLVGAGARALFYPTLLYNVLRNKMQAKFRWWDWVDEFVLLGAVPFPAHVGQLKELGVRGVITLNEPYETLVPTSLYAAHDISHLALPTRDYLFAPSLSNICQAVNFIHENALRGQSTYVHCKAGRGRSTTVVICYLVQHKQMTPEVAFGYVKSIRPRVLLAASQWQAVQDYYRLEVKSPSRMIQPDNRTGLIPRARNLFATRDIVAFDDGSVVVVTEEDLDGYNPNHDLGNVERKIWVDLRVIYRVRVAGQTAFAKLSCFWFRSQMQSKVSNVNIRRKGSCPGNGLGPLSVVDIHVY